MTHRSEIFFMNIIQRIELLWIWFKEVSLFLTWLKKWTFLSNMTQRSELFWTFEPLLLVWRKELNFFLDLTQRIEPFSRSDAKNWTFLVFQCDSKNLSVFLKMTQRIFWIWFKELNFCQIYTTQSQRIELFFSLRLNESNTFCMWFMFSNDLKNFFLEKFFKELIFHMTQRMVPDAKTWNFCFWNLIQRFGLFFFKHSQTWSFFQWLKELDLVFQMTQIIEIFQMTQRMEPSFQYVWMNWTHLIDDSQNWTFFLNPTHRFFHFLNMTFLRNWFFWIRFKEWTFSLIRPKNWTFLWYDSILKKESHIIDFFSMTPRIELQKKRDSGNRTFCSKNDS